MAIVIDADGKETVGGIAAVRDAFNIVGAPALTCTDARMRYGAGNTQILEFVGKWCVDGRPFALISAPIPPGMPLAAQARAMARELIANGHG
jgi:hypothetical protein